MKLAEALMERADKSRRMQDLRERIIRNAKHQEGDKPSEDPQALLSEYAVVAADFEQLVIKINLTNHKINIADGTSMVKALARRDSLKLRHALYKSLVAEATPKQDRYSKKEIKFVSSVNVQKMQVEADLVARNYRELDALIQQANWQNDLN